MGIRREGLAAAWSALESGRRVGLGRRMDARAEARLLALGSSKVSGPSTTWAMSDPRLVVWREAQATGIFRVSEASGSLRRFMGQKEAA